MKFNYLRPQPCVAAAAPSLRITAFGQPVWRHHDGNHPGDWQQI